MQTFIRAPTIEADVPRRRLAEIVERVEVHQIQILITLASAVTDTDRVITLPWTPRQSKPMKAVHDAPMPNAGSAHGGPDRDRAQSRRLIKAIACARRWVDDLTTGRVDSTRAIATREGKSDRNIRMMINLAFLDPSIVDRAVAGTLPISIGATDIVRDLPLAWSDQRKMLGI